MEVPEHYLFIYNHLIINISNNCHIYYNENNNMWEVFFQRNNSIYTFNYINDLFLQSGDLFDIINNLQNI